MLVFERMLTEKDRLTEENKDISKRLKNAPDGILQIRKYGDNHKLYYRTNDDEGHIVCEYLRKRERERIGQLATKTYLQQKYADNEAEIMAIDSYLRKHRIYNKSDKTKGHDRILRQLLGMSDLEKDLAEWQSQPYERCPKHAENLKIRAANGEMVRSKSEAFILSTLKTANIPCRYECRLDLGDTTVYPDFTIRRPSDGELILWEHFGMMSDPVYVKNAIYKISMYIENGYYPMKNLITTYEQDGNAFDFSEVMDIIEWLAT